MQSESGGSPPLLAELDALLARLTRALERMRRARALLADRLAAGVEPIEPVTLERLIAETDELIARGDQLSAVAEELAERRPPPSTPN